MHMDATLVYMITDIDIVHKVLKKDTHTSKPFEH